MATTRNGDVELHYEAFGSPEHPTLLLVNGLGSQSTSYAEAWIDRFVAEGYQVVRFDNRDTGLSSKLEDQSYGLVDMALDAVAVLDALGVERAHVLGCSMGGMIVQRLAIDHPDRLLSMTSVMSRTGEAEYGQSSPEALAALVAPPATTREEYVERMVANQHVYGSKPEWIDDEEVARRMGASFDRCYCPTGTGRQMLAVMADGSRAEARARQQRAVEVEDRHGPARRRHVLHGEQPGGASVLLPGHAEEHPGLAWRPGEPGVTGR